MTVKDSWRAFRENWQRARRMGLAAVLGLATSLAILTFYPAQLGVVLAAANKVALGAWLGYWFDSWLFPYFRPDQVARDHVDAASIRRAIVVGSAMLAMALAV